LTDLGVEKHDFEREWKLASAGSWIERRVSITEFTRSLSFLEDSAIDGDYCSLVLKFSRVVFSLLSLPLEPIHSSPSPLMHLSLGKVGFI
jgi:hypothetical protein